MARSVKISFTQSAAVYLLPALRHVLCAFAADKSAQIDDLAWCNSSGVDHQSSILPGGIDHPRQHGNLMWEEFANLRSIGAQSGFITMFDEFGEGDHIMPTAEDPSMSPTPPVRKLVPGAAVSLQAMANGMCVRADNTGANPLIANRATYGTWETYAVRTY